MNIFIIGSGVSGRAAQKLATVLGYGSRMLSDGEAEISGRLFENIDLIVLSPGVRRGSPLLAAAEQSGIEIVGELEFAARRFPGRTLAITGTNGKTTTTELTVALLQAAGLPATPAGNIGVPLSAVAAAVLSGELPPETLPVIEVSSFQLERVRDFRPFAAVLLNVESDHIDRYPGGMAEYRAVKERIFRGVPPENRIFGRSMNPAGGRVTVSPAGVIAADGRELLDFRLAKLKGAHNLENLVAALELCCRVLPPERIMPPELIAAALAFSPGRHRLEELPESGGVRFVNDSKATNPASVIAAVKALESKNLHIILGGLDKDMDFTPLRQYADCFKGAYVIGRAAAKIIDCLGDVIPCTRYPDFPSCVRAARAAARPGEIVLLSPGCASMDMFRDYQDRGDQFRKLVGEGA